MEYCLDWRDVLCADPLAWDYNLTSLSVIRMRLMTLRGVALINMQA